MHVGGKNINIIELNTEINDDNRIILSRLFAAYTNINLFSEKETYYLDDNPYKLSHSILKRRRSKKHRENLIVYECLLPYGAGAHGVSIIFKMLNENAVSLGIKKKRLVKIWFEQENYKYAAEMNLRFRHLKPKPIIFDKEMNAICLVMKCLPGVAADALKITDWEVLLIITWLALNKLAAIHERGYIHADVKPHNLMIDVKRLKVNFIDFDLSRSINLCRKNDHPLKLTNLEGTPDYVSPEQVEHGYLLPESDIWSLGLLLSILWGATPPEVETSINGISKIKIPKPTLAGLFKELNMKKDKDFGLIRRHLEKMVDFDYKKRISLPILIENFRLMIHNLCVLNQLILNFEKFIDAIAVKLDVNDVQSIIIKLQTIKLKLLEDYPDFHRLKQEIVDVGQFLGNMLRKELEIKLLDKKERGSPCSINLKDMMANHKAKQHAKKIPAAANQFFIRGAAAILPIEIEAKMKNHFKIN